MAKMIPSRYDSQKTGYGERQAFHALEELPDNYYVFHSLGLTGHDYKVYAELDFVVVCPRGVLCLEVKGGQVSRSGGMWIYSRGGSYYEKAESPFQQAVGAANALRSQVAKRFGKSHAVHRTCYAAGVLFPDISFNLKDPEIDLEMVYDKDSGDIAAYIERAFNTQCAKLESRHKIVPDALDNNAIKLLAEYLRGDFNFVPSLGTVVERTEQEIVRLTRQQLDALDAVAENPRLLLSGGAGTGKTLLCMEHARKLAEEGKRVLYVCFNHNLAYYLQQYVARNPVNGDFSVEAFPRMLEEKLGPAGLLPEKPVARRDQGSYWDELLPQAFIDAAEELDFSLYDYLVVDEGQDLMRPVYLMAMDMLVEGGLATGNWLMAYDANQNLYNTVMEDGLKLAADCSPARYTLKINCRNTRQIINYAARHTGISEQHNLRLDGPAVKTESYAAEKDLLKKLEKLLTKLRSQGVELKDICVLSTRRRQNSVLSQAQQLAGVPIQDIGDLPPDKWERDSLKYCTLYRFKGLESPVVILVDIREVEGAKAVVRNYTAMTRAQSLLFVFCHQSVAHSLCQPDGE